MNLVNEQQGTVISKEVLCIQKAKYFVLMKSTLNGKKNYRHHS